MKKKIKVEEVHDEVEASPEKETRKSTKNVAIYTYVGGGEGSPHFIDFMGKQKFTRGVATEITDPMVLAKVAINPCFVEGEVAMEDIHKYDEEAKSDADKQRARDQATSNAFKKKQREIAKGLPSE